MCVAAKPLSVWLRSGQLIVPDAERGVNNGKDHCSFFIAVQDLSLRPRSAQCPLPWSPTTTR